MSSDHTAAREALMEFVRVHREKGFTTISDLAESWCDERFPAPPAPETVTVDWDGASCVLARNEKAGWNNKFGLESFCAGSFNAAMCDRIASDARVLKERDARIAELEVELHETRERQLPMVRLRDEAYRQRDAAHARIAELETQLQRALDGAVFHEKRAHHAEQERDAALRALEEKAGGEVGVTTAACGGSGVTQPESSNSGESSVAAPSSAAPSPAPRRWLVVALRDGRAMYIYEDNKIGAQLAEAAAQPEGRSVVPVVEAVATRETVERVRKALRQAFRATRVGEDFTENCTRAALTAAGFTLEEGA